MTEKTFDKIYFWFCITAWIAAYIAVGLRVCLQ